MTTIDHQQTAIDQVAEIIHDCFGCSPGGEASPGCECDPEPYESNAEHILTAATPHLRAGIAEEVRNLRSQFHVTRDLLDHENIKAVDAQPLWRDRDREDWMREGSIHLELVDAPYMAVAINPAWIESGTSVMIEDADEMVAILPKHLPALIAMLQEVQRRIGDDPYAEGYLTACKAIIALLEGGGE